MPGTVPDRGVGETEVNKAKIPALMELTFQVRHSITIQIINYKCVAATMEKFWTSRKHMTEKKSILVTP